MEINVGISNKHLHLSREDVEKLFGKGHQLNNIKDLGQPGQFACEEKVDIKGPKGCLNGVRVLGPERKVTQVELSFTDARNIGIAVPVRDSGDLAGSPGVTLVGPEGTVELKEGCIAAARHIHIHSNEAEKIGLKDKDRVSVEIPGERGLIFNNVLVRVNPAYAAEFHVDTDEGNAAGLTNNDTIIIKK